MHVTMVKKRLRDGSECRKCVEATEHLKARGLWDRIDEIVWAAEDDDASAGMVLGARLGVPTAPFFVVTSGEQQRVYASVLQLVRDQFGQAVTVAEQAASIDVDDIGI